MNVSAISTPDSLFSDIMEYVTRADEMLEARDTLSLVTLNDMVDTLCQRILELNPDQSAHYADQLQGVMDRLSQLQARMIAAQNEVADAIKGVNQGRKANRAYITAPES